MDCSAPSRDPLALGQTYVEWVYDEGGSLLSWVSVRAADRSGAEYWLEGRLRFGGEDVTWSQGPYALEGLETIDIAVDLPAAALFSEAQQDYASDLVVRIVAIDELSGKRIEKESAPWLRVVWPDGEEPLLMDSDLAAELAPGGVYIGGAASGIERHEEEGFVYEYGPSD